MLLHWKTIGSCRLVSSLLPSSQALSSMPHVNANNFITKFRNAQKTKLNSKHAYKNNNTVPIISCKRKEFNHYSGQTYSKFEPIPLASTGWHHKKSKGDYFIITEVGGDEKVTESTSFEETGISPELSNALRLEGIATPTSIQAKGIPALLSRNNALIAAETGCGKTLAYLLPLLHQISLWRLHLGPERRLNTPLGLVITPSRELAHQIMEVAEQLTKHTGNSLECRLVTGGRTKQAMLHPTLEPVDLLVATLGALSKLTTSGVYNVKMVRHVVLDEADTLLDDSFIEKLSYFLRKFPFHYKGSDTSHTLPSGAQLTLVSATMPTSLPEALAEIIVPESLQKVTTSRLHHFLPNVLQRFVRLGPGDKPNELLRILHTNKNTPTIIFSNKSSTCDWISLFLNENNIKCVNLNGDMALVIRTGKFQEFQSGEVNVLSCTDVAARGLDTIRAGLVINYEFPLYTADYIHRCGRTGRVGSPKSCKVINLVSKVREIDLVQKMEMSARKLNALPNVNANISNIIQQRIQRNSQDSSVTKMAAEL